jgi:hypothetical protein
MVSQTHRELVNRPFQFQKRSQHFIGSHDETLSVTMRVQNPDRSPFAIHRCHVSIAPSGFAEIISDDFPVLHRAGLSILLLTI